MKNIIILVFMLVSCNSLATFEKDCPPAWVEYSIKGDCPGMSYLIAEEVLWCGIDRALKFYDDGRVEIYKGGVLIGGAMLYVQNCIDMMLDIDGQLRQVAFEFTGSDLKIMFTDNGTEGIFYQCQT